MTEMKRVVFSPNVPQQLAVVNPEGDYVVETWGDRVHYETTDGRILDVSMAVAADINLLDLRPGEAFCICRRSGTRDEAIRWDVWRAGASEKSRAREERSEIEQQLRDSVDLANEKRRNFARRNGDAGGGLKSARSQTERTGRTPVQEQHSTEARKPIAIAERPAAEQPAMMHFVWCQHLLSQTQALVDVMAAAVEYAGQRYGTAVKNEDVRALVITGYINMRQNGGANAA